MMKQMNKKKFKKKKDVKKKRKKIIHSKQVMDCSLLKKKKNTKHCIKIIKILNSFKKQCLHQQMKQEEPLIHLE